MAYRTVELVIPPAGVHFVGDGFRVHNFIPSHASLSMQRMSPFILLDYNSKYYFPPAESPRGVGVHPHRGFETVTIAYKGKVQHHDSTGAGGIIEEGDVQWMTAASGVLHKEYHEKEWSKKGGELHMVQLWVNLPGKDKKNPPKYQSITNAQIQRYELEQKQGVIEVIAGQYKGVQGPASTFTPIHLLTAKLKKAAKTDFNTPSHYNTALLVLEGQVKINESVEALTDHFVLFKNDNENFVVEATEDASFLVMSGQAIQEPIFARGPFVMNTREEIVQAYDDYNEGKFGYLAD